MRYLPSRDKSNCLRLCQAWYEHISQAAWFNNLSLTRNNRLDEAQELFTQKPHLGKHVKYLFLLAEVDDDQVVYNNIMNIPKVLSNIKSLESVNMGRTLNHGIFDTTGNTFDKWDKLESIVDRTYHLQITRFLLNAGICMYLQDLHIFALHYEDCFDNLLNTLHNAPLLNA